PRSREADRENLPSRTNLPQGFRGIPDVHPTLAREIILPRNKAEGVPAKAGFESSDPRTRRPIGEVRPLPNNPNKTPTRVVQAADGVIRGVTSRVQPRQPRPWSNTEVTLVDDIEHPLKLVRLQGINGINQVQALHSEAGDVRLERIFKRSRRDG